MILCPFCGETVDPCSYTAEIFYCPQCSMELSAEDVRQAEVKLNEQVKPLSKQKEILTADEARERWRQEVARQLGEPNWPEQTEEEKARWDEYMKHGTASNYKPWPEIGDERNRDSPEIG